ncbi:MULTISPECIES: ubiquinol-cytochrome c reductase iron-sulfur subunit [Marinomonas]|uniref:ubiquinol-cytochrome c reductase iron-sulfur subunit n=1 Tax=Marinomonas TaxID=28253 RepID=UPI00105572E1|nr:ubiquinol-cytochrome c reductase iron-sulfur subunit [Marinomonas flavescens]
MAAEVNKGRRQFLIGSTCALSAVGAAGIATPFITSWQPSRKSRAAGAPVQVDISKLEFGQQMTVEWQGQPIWIVRRTAKNLADLASLDKQLIDPLSNKDQQPDYAQNEYRSIKPEISVLVGICTHLGCSPTYRPDVGADDSDNKWRGGFICPCHGSRFDLAGRAYKNYPAQSNLLVPPYFFKDDTIIEIGISQKAAV